jgi:hypothetical protein
MRISDFHSLMCGDSATINSTSSHAIARQLLPRRLACSRSWTFPVTYMTTESMLPTENVDALNILASSYLISFLRT